MNGKRTIYLFISFTGSITIVLVLVALSRDMTRRPGSFLRQFPPHPALEAGVIGLEFSDYYLAGSTSRHAYLANYSAPLHLIVVDALTLDTSHVQLKIKGIEDQTFWSARVKVDSPYFYLFDGAVPRIYSGKVKDWQAKRLSNDNAYFLDFEPLSTSSFAIRALGRPLRENILGKLSTNESHVLMKADILKKQVDGIFCTDGTMHFDKHKRKLVYLYLYRNEYIVMDSNLVVLNLANTIDTTTHADIKVAMLNSTGEIKFATPQRVVNRSSFISDGLLFVNSLLTAKNENPKATDHSTVIDVYNLVESTYRFSFYVYDYQNKERMNHFQVSGNRLYTMHDHHLQIWNLESSFFEND